MEEGFFLKGGLRRARDRGVFMVEIGEFGGRSGTGIEGGRVERPGDAGVQVGYAWIRRVGV